MKYNFCTLFDSYYLTRGLALYYSLEETCEDFQIYIFAFDDKCYASLQSLKLEKAKIVSLKDFEDSELLRVKQTRTIAEYCWTCASATIRYSLATFNLDHCTYLDADIMFFSSPAPIFEAIGRNSVGITPHNFSPRYKSNEIYGKYCVQFVYFKNDKYGLLALNWWYKNCIEWCFARMENGKFGDQKYLDSFNEKFINVFDITHFGTGLAPWNIDNFSFSTEDKDFIIASKKDPGEKFPLIFYHYQGLKFYAEGGNVIAEAAQEKIPAIVLDNIYLPYIRRLIAIKKQISCTEEYPGQIVFRRRLKTIIGFNIKLLIRRFELVRKIRYLIQRDRYNRPEDIGTDI